MLSYRFLRKSAGFTNYRLLLPICVANMVVKFCPYDTNPLALASCLIPQVYKNNMMQWAGCYRVSGLSSFNLPFVSFWQRRLRSLEILIAPTKNVSH